MLNYEIKSSDKTYDVSIFNNEENAHKSTAGFKKGEKVITIYPTTDDSCIKGMMYWSNRKPFKNPKNDYEEILNYLLANVL